MAPRPAALSYVHLKVHSAYSLLEGALQIPKIAKLAIAHGMPAVGLTDTNNMFGALEFSDKLAEAGLQPIVGCTLQIDLRESGGKAAPQAASRRQRAADQARRRHCGLRPHGAGLRQPDEARERLLPQARGQRAAARQDRRPRGALRRSDRADRRPRRPGRWRAPSPASRTSPASGSKNCTPPSTARCSSSCSATAWRTRPPPSRSWSTSPTSTTCRSSPPTTCYFADARRCTRRTTRCSASPTAPSSTEDDRRR